MNMRICLHRNHRTYGLHQPTIINQLQYVAMCVSTPVILNSVFKFHHPTTRDKEKFLEMIPQLLPTGLGFKKPRSDQRWSANAQCCHQRVWTCIAMATGLDAFREAGEELLAAVLRVRIWDDLSTSEDIYAMRAEVFLPLYLLYGGPVSVSWMWSFSVLQSQRVKNPEDGYLLFAYSGPCSGDEYRRTRQSSRMTQLWFFHHCVRHSWDTCQNNSYRWSYPSAGLAARWYIWKTYGP